MSADSTEALLAELAEGFPKARAAVFGRDGAPIAAAGPGQDYDSRFPVAAVRLVSSSDGLQETAGDVVCITAKYSEGKVMAVVPAGARIFAVLAGDGADPGTLHARACAFARRLGSRDVREEAAAL